MESGAGCRVVAYLLSERTRKPVDDYGDGNRLRTIASGKSFEFKPF